MLGVSFSRGFGSSQSNPIEPHHNTQTIYNPQKVSCWETADAHLKGGWHASESFHQIGLNSILNTWLCLAGYLLPASVRYVSSQIWLSFYREVGHEWEWLRPRTHLCNRAEILRHPKFPPPLCPSLGWQVCALSVQNGRRVNMVNYSV